MRYKIAICDDETWFVDYFQTILKGILQRNQLQYNIYLFSDGAELLKSCEEIENQYNIIFLDINMPNLNGKEIALKIRKLDKACDLVFISSLNAEVYNVFKFEPVCFICKSNLTVKLEPELLRIIEKCKYKDKDYVWCKTENKNMETILMRVLINDITYIESVSGTIFLHKNRCTKQDYSFG